MSSTPDEPRAQALRERLTGTEAESYVDAPHQICFSVRDSAVVTSDGAVMLPRDGDETALAARLGHLLEHVVRGTLRPGTDCDVLVHEALQREASAYALEIRLRDRFGLGAADFVDLETAYRREGETGILNWLIEHPEGGVGVDALGRSYQDRCEAGQ